MPTLIETQDRFKLSGVDRAHWQGLLKFFEGGGVPPPPVEHSIPPGGAGGIPVWARYFITFQLGFLAANFVPLLPAWVGISVFVVLGLYVFVAATRRWR